MNSTAKFLLIVLMVGIAAGFAVIQVQNRELVRGQIFGDQEVEYGLPDLTATAEPVDLDDNNNLRVRVTVENKGEGPVFGDNPYAYGLYLNDELILTNTDSYTQMNPGDSFSFIYPIDREVYTYENSGTLKVVIDETNEIEELNEDNNSSETAYSF
jgi:subtilase family serine protease